MRAVLILLLLLAPHYAGASQKIRADSVVTPIHAPLFSVPQSCADEDPISNESGRFVTLYGIVDWEGRATQIQITDPSDNCLKASAVETVREWRFDPIPIRTDRHTNRSFTVTIVYPIEGEPNFEIDGHDDIRRFPPRYPNRCQAKASALELVAIDFDVNEKGRTENIESDFFSNSCFKQEAINSVKRWRYKPRMIDGRAYPRLRIHTVLTFEQAIGRQQRRDISKELWSIADTLDRKLDPRIALEKIALFEKEFPDLSQTELATLMRYRGIAKIDARDYEGALSDFTSALELEKNTKIRSHIEGIMEQLRVALKD